MSRLSVNENANGCVFNGFDYGLQVWVKQGIIENCGHPELKKKCCNGRKYAGISITEIGGN